MKEKKKAFDENQITGFFDKETKIKGDLSFKGAFHIDGHFIGKINSESVLIIGDNGKVEADVTVGHLIVNGEIKGNVQAKNRIEIHSTGRVIGTVVTPTLVVEEGAFLESNCQTTDTIPPPMSEKKAVEKKVFSPAPEKEAVEDEVSPSTPEDKVDTDY
ncbi:MAG: polymer-forming cytoskeletal protein [Candidatus Aminicenantes bacterium]|nr:polymer-forming cytoskeletal protein [Candidatus Aminicenantes bacterium]